MRETVRQVSDNSQVPLTERERVLVDKLWEACLWLRQTEDGSDSQIARIYGNETLDQLRNWEAVVADTLNVML